MEYDIFSDGNSVLAVDSANIATATTTYGEWIDIKGYNSIVVALQATITTGQIDSLSFQDSDVVGHADAATVIDDDTLYVKDDYPLTVTGLLRIGTVTKKRYVRLAIVTSGTVDVDVFGIAELRHPENQPSNSAL